MTRLRAFLAEERGTATIEFVFIIPIVLTIFFASFESSMFMIRHVRLERSVDIVVRDIRLGNLDGLSPADLKELICENGAMVSSLQQCIDTMRIWMQPVDTATFAMVAPPRSCIDRGQPVNTNIENNAAEFRFGSDNEIMLMRICLKEEPLFPTTIVGAGLVADGENDGSYALVTTTIFVNEPG